MYKHKSKVALFLVVLMVFSIFPYIPILDGGRVEAAPTAFTLGELPEGSIVVDESWKYDNKHTFWVVVGKNHFKNSHYGNTGMADHVTLFGRDVLSWTRAWDGNWTGHAPWASSYAMQSQINPIYNNYVSEAFKNAVVETTLKTKKSKNSGNNQDIPANTVTKQKLFLLSATELGVGNYANDGVLLPYFTTVVNRDALMWNSQKYYYTRSASDTTYTKAYAVEDRSSFPAYLMEGVQGLRLAVNLSMNTEVFLDNNTGFYVLFEPNSGYSSVEFGGGRGIESDPYLIYNIEQFLMINGHRSHFKLMNDLDFQEMTDLGVTFSGVTLGDTAVFDGNGKTIKNLKLSTSLFTGESRGDIIKKLKLDNVHVNTASSSHVGLLKDALTNGSIENIEINNSSIVAPNARAIGGLVGATRRVYSYDPWSIIEDLKMKNVVINATNDSNKMVGGVVGYSTGTTFTTQLGYGGIINVKDTILDGVTIRAKESTGGVLGWGHLSGENILFQGYIEAPATNSWVGGAVGKGGIQSSSGVHVRGVLKGENVGGLLGGTENIMGLVSSAVVNSSFIGIIEGTAYVGDIQGGQLDVGRKLSAQDVYSIAKISGSAINMGADGGAERYGSYVDMDGPSAKYNFTTDFFVWGKVSKGLNNYVSSDKMYSIVDHNGDQDDFKRNTGYYGYSHADHNFQYGGNLKSDIEMKMSNTFSGWDFTNTWQNEFMKTYPVLRTLKNSDGTPFIMEYGKFDEYIAEATGHLAEPSLKAPVNLQVTEITSTSAKLKWDAVSNAENYRIEVKQGEEWNLIDQILTTERVLTDLTANSPYTYRVIAIQGENESPPTEVSFTTLKETFNDLQMSITRVDDTTIEVSWNPVIEGTNYTLAFSGVSPSPTIEYQGNKAVVTGISKTAAYTATLTASKENYEDKVIIESVTPPSQPIIIDINISIEDGKVIITWNPVLGATGYRIKVNPEFVIDDPAITSQEIPLHLLQPKHEYIANVTALGVGGSESVAAQSTFTTPEATAEGTVVIRYQDQGGKQIKAPDTFSNVIGSNVYQAAEIPGYVKPVTDSVTLEVTEQGQTLEHTFVYTALTHELLVDPNSISIDRYNNKTRIQWDAVLGADVYEVYANDARIGNTASNSIQSNNINYGEVTIRIHVIKNGITGEGSEVVRNYLDPSNIFENVTFEKTAAQRYLMKWEGASSGSVQLKQEDVVKKSVNGRFNQAVLLQVSDGIYEAYINGLRVATLNTYELDSGEPTPTGNFSNVTVEKNDKGYHIVKWEGTTTATVELKQETITKYQVNGRFNQAVFVSVSPGTYDLFVGGKAFGQLIVEGEQGPEETEQPGEPAITNVTVETNGNGHTIIKWEGNSSATVELKQESDVKYSVNGRFNQAIFTNLADGVYAIYIDGKEVETLTVESEPKPEAPVEPNQITNIQVVENADGRIVVKWEGNGTQTVSLRDGESTIKYTSSGRFNQAVFLSVANGEYTVFVGDTEGIELIVNIEEIEEPSQPEPEIENVSVEKNDRGTYFIRWEGNPVSGTLKLMIDNKVIHSANGRFNLASFSKIYNGEYQVFLDDLLIGEIEINEENNEAPIDTGNEQTFSIEKSGARYLIKWTGGGSKDSLVIKQGENTAVNLTSTRFRQSVVTLEDGIYELYIAGERKGIIATHSEFTSEDGKVVIIDPINNDVVYRDSFEEIEQEGEMVKVYEVYQGSLATLTAIK